MNDNHIKYFKVENFKRFKSFEMHDMGQFNLIVGDNNVGKTSVLEALLVDENEMQLLKNYQNVLSYRKFAKTKETLHFFTSQKKETTFTIKNSNEHTHTIKIDLHKVSDFKTIETDVNQRIPLIYLSVYDNDLVELYGKHFQFNKKERTQLIKSLRTFIPDAENIEVSSITEPTILIVFQENRNEAVPLGMCGEGAIKLMRILIEISVNQGSRLMIDEIDAGVHFSRFKEFWRTILLAANENNVQLFATTHNWECINHFVEALKSTELIGLQDKSRVFRMSEISSEEVRAYNYNFKQFNHSVEIGNEIRGGE